MAKLRKLMGVFGAFAFLLGLSACDGGGGGGTVVITRAWYNVYGDYCGTTVGPGCDFYFDGSKIMYSDAAEVYYAPLTYGTWFYYDVYGHPGYYTGWTRITADGIMYNEYGYALNAVNAGRGKDMASNAAAAQKEAINGASLTLQAKYGLDADAASNIAITLNDWALLAKSKAGMRKRTDADAAAFAKRLSGLDISDISAAADAVAKGDLNAASAEQAFSKAAQYWSTSPDTAKQIAKDLFSSTQNQ